MSTQCKHPRLTPGEAAKILYRYYMKTPTEWIGQMRNFIHGTGFEATWRFSPLQALQSTIAKVEILFCNYCDRVAERKEGKRYFQELRCSNAINRYPITFEYYVQPLREDNILRKYLENEGIELYGDDPHWKLE